MKVIYTDGSCHRNPGPGGFGVLVCEAWGDEDPSRYIITDAYQEFNGSTTNNREEMKAILWALENYGDEAHRENGFNIPVVYSDSAYCVNSFTKWISGWKANGWTRAKGKKLENLDLILKYDKLLSKGYKINLKYIKGHNGDFGNELADKLATGVITKEQALIS